MSLPDSYTHIHFKSGWTNRVESRMITYQTHTSLSRAHSAQWTPTGPPGELCLQKKSDSPDTIGHFRHHPDTLDTRLTLPRYKSDTVRHDKLLRNAPLHTPAIDNRMHACMRTLCFCIGWASLRSRYRTDVAWAMPRTYPPLPVYQWSLH